MAKYSFHTFNSARRGIPDEEKRRISQYKRADMGRVFSLQNDSENEYWRALTEGVEIVKYHPNGIVRHEAAEALGETFCIGSIGGAADLAKIIIFPKLYHPDLVETALEALENNLTYFKSCGYTHIIEELHGWFEQHGARWPYENPQDA